MKKSHHTEPELVSILLEFAAEYKVDNILRLVVDRSPRLSGAIQASFFEAQRETNRIGLRDTNTGNRQNIGERHYKFGQGLTGWVAKTGRPLRLRNIQDEKERKKIDPALAWSDKYGGYEKSKEKEKQKAYLAVPIKIDDIVVGVLRIARTEEPGGYFTRQDEDLLVTFAERLSSIIKKAEIIERAQKLDELLDQFYFRYHGSLESYLEWVANVIPAALNADACSIFLRETGSSYLLRATTEGGALADQVGKAEYKPGEGLTGWVLLTGEPARVVNVRDGLEVKNIHPELKWIGKYKDTTSSHVNFLAAPIRTKGEIWGVVRLAKSSREVPFTSDDEKLLCRYGDRLGLYLQSLELAEQKTMVVRPRWPGRYSINNKLCYVLMPFSVDWSNNVRREIRSAAKRAGLRIGIADEDHGHFILEDVWRGICEARIVVADLTGGNPNVAYEVGLADVLGRDIILLAQDPSSIPFDFLGARLIVYSTERLEELQTRILQRMKHLLDRRTS